MVDRFIEQKQAKGFADASINRYLAALRRAFTLGTEAPPPLVSTMPKFEELMLDEHNVREGFLEHYQYLNLRNELPEHQRIVLVIGYHFGMRRGEILSLRWDQVDWDGNLIRLEKRQTKAKESRQAPLYGDVRPMLEMAFAARDPDCPYIVAWRGEGIEQVETAWNKARIRASVPELLVHDLRRTAARNMIRAGVPEKQVMLIVGWKSRAMFDRYNIIDERDLQLAGQKLDRFAAEQNAKVRTAR